METVQLFIEKRGHVNNTQMDIYVSRQYSEGIEIVYETLTYVLMCS